MSLRAPAPNPIDAQPIIWRPTVSEPDRPRSGLLPHVLAAGFAVVYAVVSLRRFVSWDTPSFDNAADAAHRHPGTRWVTLFADGGYFVAERVQA